MLEATTTDNIQSICQTLLTILVNQFIRFGIMLIIHCNMLVHASKHNATKVLRRYVMSTNNCLDRNRLHVCIWCIASFFLKMFKIFIFLFHFRTLTRKSGRLQSAIDCAIYRRNQKQFCNWADIKPTFILLQQFSLPCSWQTLKPYFLYYLACRHI